MTQKYLAQKLAKMKTEYPTLHDIWAGNVPDKIRGFQYC